jgi:hypothetical protein
MDRPMSDPQEIPELGEQNVVESSCFVVSPTSFSDANPLLTKGYDDMIVAPASTLATPVSRAIGPTNENEEVRRKNHETH